MTAIEPGDKFVIGYGNGHSLEVGALSLRQKRLLTAELAKIQKAQADNKIDEIYELVGSVLEVAIGQSATADIIDSVDEDMAMEIVNAVMSKTALTEDEVKKSE